MFFKIVPMCDQMECTSVSAGAPALWSCQEASFDSLPTLSTAVPLREDRRNERGQTHCWWSSKDLALINGEELPPVLPFGLVDCCPHSVLKHLLHAPVAEGRALQVAFGSHLLGKPLPVYGADAGGAVGPHVPLVSLSGHYQNRDAGQMAADLTNPFVPQVQKGIVVCHWVAHQHHICLLVWEGANAFEGITARCVPKT